MIAGKKPARATSFLRLVFESFDVHSSLIYKKRPQHIANEAKQGKFINKRIKLPKNRWCSFQRKVICAGSLCDSASWVV